MKTGNACPKVLYIRVSGVCNTPQLSLYKLETCNLQPVTLKPLLITVFYMLNAVRYTLTYEIRILLIEILV